MAIVMTIVILFVVVNLAIGFWSSRKVTSEGFMTAERKMTFWVLVFSTFTTSIGAGDIFSYPALGYMQGWSALHFVWAMPVFVILMAFTVGKRYYKLNVRTISDMLCRVYGENTFLRVFSSICMGMGLIAWTATQYSAFGKSLNLLTGASPLLGMFIGAIVFISYTVAGGLVSVMAVSIIQGIMMIIGIVMIFFATNAAGGGYTTVQAALPESYHTFLGPAGAMTIVMFWMNKGLSRFTNFTYWQRIGASKSANTGIWGVSIGMLVTAGLGVLLAAIGMNYHILKPAMADPEMVFPDAALTYFPTWVTGIIVGALWAAILSSAGGFLNSASTLIGNDIWFRAMKKEENSDEKTKLRHLKIVTVVLGVVTFMTAWLIPSVLSLMVWAGVWLTPPLLPVLFATLFDQEGKKVNQTWIIISMIVSAAVGVYFEVSPAVKGYFSGGTIPAFVSSLIVLLIGMSVCSGQRGQKA